MLVYFVFFSLPDDLMKDMGVDETEKPQYELATVRRGLTTKLSHINYTTGDVTKGENTREGPKTRKQKNQKAQEVRKGKVVRKDG